MRLPRILRPLFESTRPPRRLSFSREGWIFTGLTFPIGFAAINTGNNMLYLVLGMMLSIIALNGFLSEASIRGIQLRVRFPKSAFAEENIAAFASLENTKTRWPSYLLRAVPLWTNAKSQDHEGRVLKLEPGETATVRIQTRFLQRGRFHARGFKLATRFPFGLFDKWREIDDQKPEIVIYPKPLWEHGSDVQQRSVGGELERNRRGMGEDLFGLRAYRTDDDARFIHWKASARTGSLIMKEFSEAQHPSRWLVFDHRVAQGSPSFETAVSRLTGYLLKGAESGVQLGLWTPERRFEPSRTTEGISEVLEFLADLQPCSRSRPETSPRPPAEEVFREITLAS